MCNQLLLVQLRQIVILIVSLLEKKQNSFFQYSDLVRGKGKCTIMRIQLHNIDVYRAAHSKN